MKCISTLGCFLLTVVCLSQQKPLFEVKLDYADSAQQIHEEIKELILNNYYYDGISENDLYWASIKGMLRHISPPESPTLATLWTEEEYEKILNSLKGVKVSLGFNSSFNGNDGSLTVTSLIKDSEASRTLKIQDRILRIDNRSLIGLNINEVNDLLDGDVGEKSTLTVVRDIDVFKVKLTREELKSENLIVNRLPQSDMALIEVKNISLGISEELKTELAKLKSEGVRSIILDFRNNGGGVLNEGINIARLFLKKGSIVVRTQSRSNGVNNFTSSEDQFTSLNLALLTNEKSASASEIVASAIRDHQRGIIIGKKTFGKGVIENTYTLSNNYRIKFISNAMYSPKGISWQTVGILPDFFVDQSQAAYNGVSQMPIEQRRNTDIHLITAIKLLND